MAIKLYGTSGSTCVRRVKTVLEIFESRAILLYLVDTYDKSGVLTGPDAKSKAIALIWLEVEHSHYNPPISEYVFEMKFKAWHGGVPDPAIAAAKTAAWEKILDVYEVQLTKNAYLAGASFTFADLSHLSYTQYALECGAKSFETRPHVKAWWDKISSRPSWVKVNSEGFEA